MSDGMSPRARRYGVFFCALCVFAFALVGCQAPGLTGGGTTNQSGGILISTPDTTHLTPTPQFPPFTIGAWPSNYSPNSNDTITLYVLCRVQNQAMTGPSTPPPSALQIDVNVGSPVNQHYSGSTDRNGLAAIPITINDPAAGQPVTVSVSTNYGGQTYSADTFFTPAPAAQPSPSPTAPAAPGTTPPASGTPSTTPGNGNGNGNGGGGGKP